MYMEQLNLFYSYTLFVFSDQMAHYGPDGPPPPPPTAAAANQQTTVLRELPDDPVENQVIKTLMETTGLPYGEVVALRRKKKEKEMNNGRRGEAVINLVLPVITAPAPVIKVIRKQMK
jgi:hypothetical protein